MRFSNFLLVLSIAGSSIAANGRRDDKSPPPTEVDRKTAVQPKRFIVEFAPGIDAKTAAADIATKAGNKLLKVFDSDVFKGAAVQAETENIDSLTARAPVLQAWQSRKIMLDPNVPSRSFSADATGVNYSIHGMTGVDKLHARGIFGKGVTVAVVDTGVDYNHPALGGGFGPGFKVAGGYDFVGDGSWPDSGAKTPDNDPADQQGHGTHVSGIIAGKEGAAAAGTDEETLIDAFLKAYDDGADIITSSIGGLSGWVDNAWALVASRLVEQGVVVTISAANDGEVGPYAASSGSSGANVLAIASVGASMIASPSFSLTFNLDKFSNKTFAAYRSSEDWYPSEVKDWPLYPLTLDTTTTTDACSPLPAGTPNLSKYVVLVRRGGCTFAVKQQNVGAAGAKYLLVYNNASPLVVPGATLPSPKIAAIAANVGEAIIGAIKAGGNVTADFTVPPADVIIGLDNDVDAGVASYFTTMGPTNELYIKPDVAAPGGQIFSTYIGGGWATLSGTSMACPYVAGVAALYISKFGGRSKNGAGFAKDLAMRIIASGDAIAWDDGQGAGTDYGVYASVAQVGTGLINAVKVLDYSTGLSFGKFALNDTHHFSRYHKIDITNRGSTPITYTFSTQDFGGMNTYVTDPAVYGAPRVAYFEDVIFSPQKMVPSVSYPGGTFTVAPGQTKTAQFNFNYPTGLDPKKLPIYSGKVLIKGSNNETVGIPYLGLAADLHKDLGIMFQYPLGYPIITSTVDYIPISEKANFTFDLSLAKQDFVNLYTKLQYATTELRWDIFDSTWTERNWKYPPVVGQAGYIGSATAWNPAPGPGFFDPATDDENDLVAFPLRQMSRTILGRSGLELWWLGKLANGTQIAPGKYKMRFAALVPFGTPQNADNWDVYQTPAITVLPKPKK
ncbi:putative Minor extracellular protease vpr [Glarea lozoyensis 74030]|uniref:Putative Minor extracellular protease vpr n=1 Tax=Glarea lozoyensis (strain ATCC 74030 / MF5533) TaxID=1104152 RepID=H0EKF6_GLAL7|nr:putative Minor extracellular protease vpr [Glarea lozoyensis 74030]